MDNPKNRRRRILIDNRLQMKYLLTIMLAMLAPLAFIMAYIYFIIAAMLSKADPNFAIAFLKNFAFAVKEIMPSLLLTLPFVAIILFCWGLIASFRIAGPMYRLEKELNRVAEGSSPKRIVFRKGDEFQSIADSVNVILEKLGKR